MYGLNVYQDYPHGEFVYLETRYIYAENREEARRIVLDYAQAKYKGITISVMNVN